ncbi:MULTISPECIES: hypothetical protein [Rhizobium]|uniref:hypothetical protein n=1 Tax=Rhizobium TaxID=379 RepID=UPI00104C5DA0|nr:MULTISPECIES: hypothetical protein [Rhizobium]NKM55158.1 hypothetical protein [Rhizobium anhuiense]
MSDVDLHVEFPQFSLSSSVVAVAKAGSVRPSVPLGNEPYGYIVVRQVRSQYVSAGSLAAASGLGKSGIKSSTSGKTVISERWIAGARFSAPLEFMSAKTKKPAAGGGAAGFRKEPNDSWEEECCRSTDDPGRRMGRLYIEGMREEVHRFDRNNHTYFLPS